MELLVPPKRNGTTIKDGMIGTSIKDWMNNTTVKDKMNNTTIKEVHVKYVIIVTII